jgi:hypothetical protein
VPVAGGHLVADEEQPELVAQLAHRAQVALGVHVDTRGALHERLDDDRRAAVGMLGQQRAQRVGVAGRHLPGVEEQRAVEGMEELDAAHGDRAQRVAVVAVGQADEARAPPLAALVVELVGHLERDLARRRAVVGEEHAAEPLGREVDQALGQLGRRGVRQAEHGRVRDAIELVLDGDVDGRVAVAVHVAPQRGDAVDVGVALGVVERRVLGRLDDREVLLLPALLLGEGVPEVLAVEVGELGGGHRHRAPQASPGRGRNA